MSGKQNNWYAVYTKPRFEKKVYKSLAEKGLEAYCPLNRVKKKWSDRMKWVEEPLFKSYVFVRVQEEELGRAREVKGVVNFVYWLGRPAIIKHKEIETIRKFLNEYEDVKAVPLDLRPDTKVTIKKGVLMDKKAKVIRALHKKVQVIIESIGYSLVAVVDQSNIALSNDK